MNSKYIHAEANAFLLYYFESIYSHFSLLCGHMNFHDFFRSNWLLPWLFFNFGIDECRSPAPSQPQCVLSNALESFDRWGLHCTELSISEWNCSFFCGFLLRLTNYAKHSEIVLLTFRVSFLGLQKHGKNIHWTLGDWAWQDEGVGEANQPEMRTSRTTATKKVN